MKLSHSAARRPMSGVRKMMELAWGREDVIHLEVGEPGFATPAHVRAAAARAAEMGQTRYAPTPGLPDLKEALTHKLRTVNQIQVPSPQQVVVTNGGANALFAVFGSILDPDDSILLPDPGWSNFPMIAAALGARPKYYPLTAEGGYLPDPDQIAALIDDSTKAVVLNSPSNPLGSVIPRTLAERLLEVCAAKDVWLISDECYDDIDFSGEFVSIGSLERAPQRVVSVFSFSKVHAMTGWRVGYCALPPQMVDPVLSLLQPSVMCVNTPAQYAALAAVTGPQNHLDEWREEYRGNRNLVMDKICGSPYTARVPDGGFFVWLDVSERGLTCEEFALKLLADRGVALTPGTAFGALGEGYVRLSLATPREQLAEGIERLITF